MFRIFLVQLKNNFTRQIMYRSNFLTLLLVDITWMAIEMLFFDALYAHNASIAGWSKTQTYFFLGLFFTSDAIFTVFLQRNFWSFSDLVNQGELDIFLLKPANPVFLILTRFMNISSITNIPLGLWIMNHYGNITLSTPFWALYGVLIACLLRFTFSIVVFWTDRGQSLSRFYYQLFPFSTKPDTIYPSPLRLILRTILPFACIGSVPARALLGMLEPHEYILIIMVPIAFFVLNTALWKKGLKRYQSASS